MEQKLTNYINNLKAKGITIDGAHLEQLYDNLGDEIRNGANVVLLPVAVAAGVVYGMDNTDGSLVPFSFSRPSSATLFDKDKNMKLVESDMPRVDYGNYTDNAKLLVERESTNILSYSQDLTNVLWVITNISVYDSNLKFGNFAPYWTVEKTSTNTSRGMSQNIINKSYPNFEVPLSITFAVKKGNSNKFSTGILGSISRWGNHSTYEILQGEAKVVYYNGYLNVELITDEIVIKISRTTFVEGDIPFLYIYPDTASSAVIGANILATMVNGVINETSTTSYIPTTSTQSTRSADQLSINLVSDANVYLKTTKQEITMRRTAGLWNIHEQLNNEGIEALALFSSDKISSVLIDKTEAEASVQSKVQAVVINKAIAEASAQSKVQAVVVDKAPAGINYGAFM